MQRLWSRVVVCTVVLAGMVGLGTAADVSDDEFKTLITADAKTIAGAAEAGEKGTATAKKNAGAGIRSTALYVAMYANGRIGGTDDAKMAAVRDQALKIVEAAKKSDFKAAGELAKDLASPAAAGKAGKIDVAKAAGLKDDDVDLVMRHFLKTTQHASGAEEDIKKFGGKKGPAVKPEVAAAIGHRVLVMTDLTKLTPKGENAKQKKDWEEYNKKMAAAAENLLKVSQDKKATPAALRTAFESINGSCTACHNVFKNT